MTTAQDRQELVAGRFRTIDKNSNGSKAAPKFYAYARAAFIARCPDLTRVKAG